MRRNILVALAVMTLGGVLTLPALAATKSIAVGDDYFIQKGGGTVTVKQGTTVKWVFRGKSKHTVVGTGAARFINSGRPKASGAYTLRVARKGRFKLICSIHGSKQRMTLAVN